MKHNCTDDELLNILRDWADEHVGLMPTAEQLDAYLVNKGYPFTASIYEYRFDSLQRAAELAGLTYINCHQRRWARDAVKAYARWKRKRDGTEATKTETPVQA